MAISFECEGCGKSYTVGDDLAGKTGQCKQCGRRMTIPTESDQDGYGVEGLASEPEPEVAPLPPRSFKPASQSAASRRPLFDSPGTSAPKRGFFGGGGGKAVGILVAVVLIGLRVYSRWDRAQNRNARNPQAQANAGANFAPPRLVANRAGPIRLPNFPEPGVAREIEPGVSFREVDLGPDRPGALPGWSGKIWVYLPAGDHAAGSLPCVMIAGAGSNLITGMKLGDGDRPEHLPYARAGFAVVAFELDGGVDDIRNASEAAMNAGVRKFLDARAGLVNAHIALEYVLKKMPEVDPSRISAAGHSSAGTLAVLFAENEPRLRSCVAFAPALDLPKRFGRPLAEQIRQVGAGDLVDRYSPQANLTNLRCPLFLFHARDDSNIPADDSETFARLAESGGKSVTLELVPAGEHYDSMIQQGIPRAIAWLQGQGR